MAVMNATAGSSSMGFHYHHCYYHCWLSSLPAKDTKAEHLIRHQPWKGTNHQMLGGKLITLNSFHSGSGSQSPWPESTHIVGMGLPFPSAGPQSALLSKGLQGVWPTNTGSYTALSDQRIHFCILEMEVQEWAYGHEIHKSYHIPHHQEATGLTERWKGLLKMWHGLQLWGGIPWAPSSSLSILTKLMII